MTVLTLPKAFIWRKLHSLMGLWLVLFLMEHLLTNSQAALWLGDNGRGFVNFVNLLHNFPYLQVVEITLIGIPLLIHGIWGVKYALTAKSNARKTDGSTPYIKSGRNRAYSWQRITSWILLIGIVLHVIKFRFLEYPDQVQRGNGFEYLVKVNVDPGLYTVADRMGVSLFDQEAISQESSDLSGRQSEQALLEAARSARLQTIDPITGPVPEPYSSQKSLILTAAQRYEESVAWVKALEAQKINEHQVVAVAHDFGTATILSVRDTFKSPLYVGLYTIFVLAACFHAFNGLWTSMLTWGWVLKRASQRAWVSVTITVMVIVAFLGLIAIWGTYWINLRN